MEASFGAGAEPADAENASEKTVVHSFPSHYSVRDVLQKIGATDSEDAFYVVNLEKLVFRYNQVSNIMSI